MDGQLMPNLSLDLAPEKDIFASVGRALLWTTIIFLLFYEWFCLTWKARPPMWRCPNSIWYQCCSLEVDVCTVWPWVIDLQLGQLVSSVSLLDCFLVPYYTDDVRLMIRELSNVAIIIVTLLIKNGYDSDRLPLNLLFKSSIKMSVGQTRKL